VLLATLWFWLSSHLGYSKTVRARDPGIKVEERRIRKAADQIATEIGPRLRNVTLSEYPLQFPDGKQEPVVTYALTLDKQIDVYHFESTEYVVELGGQGNLIASSRLCDAVEEIVQDPNEFTTILKRLRVDSEASADVPGGVKLTIAGKNLLRTVLELALPPRAFSKIPGARAEIYVRGYADAQKTHWDRPLLDGEYHFSELEICPSFQSKSSLNPSEFSRATVKRKFGPHYYNADLPNLRAAFIRRDFIERYIRRCPGTIDPQVRILDGYEFKRHDPEQRKAQVFVCIYSSER
jgi:hypothetical protein